MKRTLLLCLVLMVLAASLPLVSLGAEVKEIRLAKQPGLGYLPLIIMEEKQLIEKNAKEAGFDVKTTWVTLSSGAAMNDALLSGSIDFISGGVAPFITLWAKTKGEVKGVSALDTTPLYLNTSNPAVHSIKDFSDKDRIALPAVKVSIQAVTLQMAAAKAFGFKNYAKLDSLTVSMGHPDAMVALLSGKSEITAHFATPPFMFRELDQAGIHTVLNSYDVLGGRHTSNVLSTSQKFYDKNPQLFAAVQAAVNEAITFIQKNQREAAAIYAQTGKSGESVEEILTQLNNPQLGYRAKPLRITQYSDFMFKIGSIDHKPGSEKDLFFPPVKLNKKGQ